MAAGSPQEIIQEQEEALQQLLEDEIIGPPRKGKGIETTEPSSIDIEQIPIPQEENLEEIFPAAGDMRNYANIENLADTLNALSANPRSNADGYAHRSEILYALDQSVSPQMITGLPESTINSVKSDFTEQGLLDAKDESLTATAQAFLQGANTFMYSNDKPETHQKFSQLSTAITGKEQPASTLKTFLYLTETNNSLTNVNENLDTTRRTVHNRYKGMEEGNIFSGKPDERVVTHHGIQAYNSIVAAAHQADRTSSTEYLTNSPF